MGIFEDYRQKRQNGLEVKDALHELRDAISALSTNEKTRLKARIRSWEQERRYQAKPEHPDARSTQRLPQQLKKCPHCNKGNPIGETVCAYCGQMMEKPAIGTQKISDPDEQDFAFYYFGSQSSLVLALRYTVQTVTLRPQERNKPVIIGRLVEGSEVKPDVDLSPFDGAEMGVSRAHLAVEYNAEDNNIKVYDLGSANGSFINGRRLHPREIVVLRNGDDIRLGRMVLRANFIHQQNKK